MEKIKTIELSLFVIDEYGRIKIPNATCSNCGKSIYVKPFRLKRNKYGHCCCKKCFNEYHRIIMQGESNHQYGLRGDKNASHKGLITTKRNNSVIDKMIYLPGHPFANKYGRVKYHRHIVELHSYLFDDKYFIEINNKKYLRPKVDVHHIDQDHFNDSIDNLMLLTKSEHTHIHNQLRKLSKHGKNQNQSRKRVG